MHFLFLLKNKLPGSWYFTPKDFSRILLRTMFYKTTNLCWVIYPFLPSFPLSSPPSIFLALFYPWMCLHAFCHLTRAWASQCGCCVCSDMVAMDPHSLPMGLLFSPRHSGRVKNWGSCPFFPCLEGWHRAQGDLCAVLVRTSRLCSVFNRGWEPNSQVILWPSAVTLSHPGAACRGLEEPGKGIPELFALYMSNSFCLDSLLSFSSSSLPASPFLSFRAQLSPPPGSPLCLPQTGLGDLPLYTHCPKGFLCHHPYPLRCHRCICLLLGCGCLNGRDWIFFTTPSMPGIVPDTYFKIGFKGNEKVSGVQGT